MLVVHMCEGVFSFGEENTPSQVCWQVVPLAVRRGTGRV
ncbi:Uncharacterised protein [Dermatophilus congolensis]|uniref:Uncharacterized protein n=1 Tax=Dermatophilus congolensis TaxID=1863 RepID=A0A239VQJ6_9MICO|nr:Uncharacterised protein [Dermatophilus congolensis]